VVFPAGLTARQRALLHEVAEDQGLGHASSGDGDQRCIAVGNLSAPGQQVRLTGSEQRLRMQLPTQSTLASVQNAYWQPDWLHCFHVSARSSLPACSGENQTAA